MTLVFIWDAINRGDINIVDCLFKKMFTMSYKNYYNLFFTISKINNINLNYYYY